MSTRAFNRYALRSGVIALAAVFAFGCEARLKTGIVVPVPQQSPDLSVSIVDASNAGLAGATATLYQRTAAGARVVKSVITNADGIATFPEPDAGEYLVYARMSGYIGGSTFAIVEASSVVAGTIKLLPLTALPDINASTVDQNGATVTTQASSTMPQSSITIAAGAFSGSSDVAIGTITGTQIPVVPEGQVALNALVIQSTGTLGSSATVSVGLPFSLPNGTVVPIYGFDEATGVWTLLANGTVTADQVVASIDDFGTMSALAGMVPRRAATQSSQVGVTKTLGPTDDAIIKTVYTPTLTFPIGTNYTDKTQNWLKGTIGGLIGMTFDEPLTLTVERDPSRIQIYKLFEHIDRYIITVSVGTSGKPAVGAKVTGSYDFLGDAVTRTAELETLHDSGTGGGV